MVEKNPYYDFYEKLYFHEIDAREKLYARITVPLAILISLAGALAFILQNLQTGQFTFIAWIFYSMFGSACAFVLLASYYLKGATSGDEYQFLGSANVWDKYHRDCDELYAAEGEKDRHVEAAVRNSICGEYVRCATINAAVNDKRSHSLFYTIKFLIIAGLLSLVAFIIFYFGGLEKGSAAPQPEAKVLPIVNLKGRDMTTEKPALPPPPPAPPARVVREDKHPPRTTPEKKPNGQ
jgi:hypothetical protein